MEDRKIHAPRQPRFLNPFAMRLPVGAVVSILHRISGVLLFLLLPVAAWLFAESLAGAEGYVRVQERLASVPGRLALIFVLWAFLHHFLAGMRFLLLDAGRGNRLAAARRMGWMALLAAPVATVALLWAWRG